VICSVGVRDIGWLVKRKESFMTGISILQMKVTWYWQVEYGSRKNVVLFKK
jgi:hypothetical protein